jgi:hypothetical protein
MPAKPQQMSDNQDKSDDLIAELAKLMASNAQGSESEPKPTVIKLAPLSEATAPPLAPIRIPGMDMPAAAAPAVRIPGMEKPAGVDAPPSADDAAPEPKVPAAAPSNLASAAAPSPDVPEPLSTGPITDTPESASAEPTPADSKSAAQAPSAPSPSVAQEPQPEDAKPHVVGASEPPSVSVPVASQPEASAANADNFDFKFDAGAKSDFTEAKEQGPAETEDAPTPAGEPEHDAIADLIAAELDAGQAEPAKPETPEPETSNAATTPAASVFPASVEAVPARNFGNNTAGQAPVLIARPVATPAPPPEPAPLVSFRPLPPVPQPPESDKFAVAPVFGLGNKPAPMSMRSAEPAMPSTQRAAPRIDSDPMDEIESLIGEAVRMELSGADKPAAPPRAETPAAPVVPPLNTGFAPRRAGLKDNEPQLRSAEDAILAAAAATGAEVGRIETEAGEDRPYKRVRVKPQKAGTFGGARQYVGMAVAGTLLLAAGFGLYWVLGMGRGGEEAPVLAADSTPAKQAPAVTASAAAQPTRSVVFDEIDGVAAVDSAETLVSRDETAGASVADVARVATPDSTENTESGLANRKVRTVTVRPDGTIVNGDEAVAGTEALPVQRPNVPVVPGAATEPSDLLTAAVAADAGTSAAAPVAEQLEELDPIAAAIADTEVEQPAPLDVAALAPTTTPAVFDASIVAPTPMPRPTDRSALSGAQQTAAAGPSAAREPASLPLVSLTDAAPAAPAVSAGAAGAYVQLASLPSEGEARNTANSMQSRLGNLLAGGTLVVQRAQLNDGRVTYRVRLPAGSLQDATQICASIKANGGDCFATNG